MTNTRLVRAELYRSDAQGADLGGADLTGASLVRVNLGVDFRSADLRDAVLDRNSFKVTLDEDVRVHGMTGSVFGPVRLAEKAGSRELAGTELERWLHRKGVDARVVPSPGPPARPLPQPSRPRTPPLTDGAGQ